MVVKKEGQKKVFVDLQNLVWFEDLQKKKGKWREGGVVKKKGQKKKVFVDLTNIGMILKFCEKKKKIMWRSGC